MNLIALTPQMTQALAHGNETVLPAGVETGPVRELLHAAAAAQGKMYAVTGATDPWLGHLAVADQDGADQDGAAQVVGVCGFKAPCRDGAVEITYFTFPPFEGQGHAAAMAGALLDIARAHPDVDTVTAHTLPRAGASTRVLERLGFQRGDAVEDPADGRVWRWSRPARP
ncbi:GNAT family N-acetyltransferase [Roseospira marina]|uniref:GNAT family N-acetyltransferase n=1 Tax=Roseospira marina TaxID=140057 RepID=A0A5M6IAD5_9PROT|nr:GNAT family N-acetyltransferase [Roseospira marina]KAA5604685.1 GNAT family N-acetyltransferase [Roseospira marina]MBB4315132.1 GNAT superfamily N-acetyltransferase [Roseospira marina]MBB5088098.1 GNAT superfamily N-acetyltransferase [Roseospira marina]